jgi:hypothetical protein
MQLGEESLLISRGWYVMKDRETRCRREAVGSQSRSRSIGTEHLDVRS